MKHLILTLSLLSSFYLISVPSLSHADEDDDLFFTEVNCDNLGETFKEYSAIVNLLQTSFTQSLSKMQNLAQKMQNKDLSREELSSLDAEIAKTKKVMLENELFVSEVSWQIEEAISNCIQ